jgi:hypothetical protein
MGNPIAERRTPAITPGSFRLPTTVLGHCATVPKDEPVRSEEYRRLVAKLPCKHCGVHGHSQAAHPNTGKGGGLKTDDRLCFPLCCDRPGVQGCHAKFDQHAWFTRAARREIEPSWGADTRRQITAMGQWPADLPKIED